MANIAVLMSTYNGEKYLRKQIESILSQVDCNIDLIVRDDGSSDSTIDILKEYEADGKLTYYCGENLKPGKSFLRLLYDSADYDYYSFADQDDIWDKDKLISGVRCLQQFEDKPAIYFSNARYIDANDNPIYVSNVSKLQSVVIRDNYWNEMVLCGATGCTMILNKRFVDIFKLSNFPSKVLLHDSYIQSMCAALGGVILYDANPHMGYRQHSNNVVGGKKGIMHSIKTRFKEILKKREVCRSDYAKEFLALYGDYIPLENRKIVTTIAQYKDNFTNKLRLAFSNKITFCKFKDAVYQRFLILLGKK